MTATLDAKCCKICRGTKKACGHYCILKDKKCNRPDGCACNGKKYNRKKTIGNNNLTN